MLILYKYTIHNMQLKLVIVIFPDIFRTNESEMLKELQRNEPKQDYYHCGSE